MFTRPDLGNVMQSLAPVSISDVAVSVTYGMRPFRFSKEPPARELFVNGGIGIDYLTAEGSDLQVSADLTTVDPTASTFGTAVPCDLDVGIGFLGVSGADGLALYSPNHIVASGHHHLTGLFKGIQA